MIGIVDYAAGNLKSVETAMKHLGADFFISKDPQKLLNADRMIFPGVGEAKASMKVLNETEIGCSVKEFAKTGKPILGICLGCQIFLDYSEERDTKCLGLISGSVKEFPKDLGLKVPHMGWNTVQHDNRHPIFNGINNNSSFYFVHSYYPSVLDKCFEIGSTEYGFVFTSAVARDNIVATQFHPEKSGKDGLKLIENFLNWSR